MWCNPLGIAGINLNRFADSGIVQNDAVGSIPGNNEEDELGRVRVVWEIKIGGGSIGLSRTRYVS